MPPKKGRGPRKGRKPKGREDDAGGDGRGGRGGAGGAGPSEADDVGFALPETRTIVPEDQVKLSEKELDDDVTRYVPLRSLRLRCRSWRPAVCCRALGRGARAAERCEAKAPPFSYGREW